jgi:hypothetical protein
MVRSEFMNNYRGTRPEMSAAAPNRNDGKKLRFRQPEDGLQQRRTRFRTVPPHRSATVSQEKARAETLDTGICILSWCSAVQWPMVVVTKTVFAPALKGDPVTAAKFPVVGSIV